MSDSSSSYTVFQYRLYPSKSQTKNLFRVLDCARNLYNMALAERKYGYQLEGHKVTLADTEALAKRYRATFPYADQLFSQTAQSVVKQVDHAYQRFFRRLKNGEKAGYPRFKNANQFNSFEFKQYGYGAKLDGRRLKLYGIGRVRWHRPLAGKIKTVRIIHQAGHWSVSFTCEVPLPEPLSKTGRAVGLDMGITALITTSEGEKVDHPQWYQASQATLRLKQRRLARAKKGSQNRQKKLLAVQRQHEKVVNQRTDFLNKLAFRLVQRCDQIALEKLRIRNMVRNHRLSKHILDSGWGYFKTHLMLKAVSAGRELVLVNPAYTSQKCSGCSELFENMTLSIRWIDCRCGLSLNRDHNAAINILSRAGWVTSMSPNVVPLFSPLRRE